MVSALLEGRTGLVVGVANKRSIAWAIARKLAETLSNPAPVLPLDVQDEAQLDAAVDGAAEALGGLDILVHGVAYAPPEALAGRFVETAREGFRTALEISAYSLTALAQRAERHMRDSEGGGSIITLTYIASDRAVPGYNIMGVAKAALECSVRYLAWDLGQSGVRVNAISAGPVRTLAARGVPGFGTMADKAAERAPLQRAITAEEVADAALFLASPLASAVTGETMFVDAGYHAMGT